MISFRKFINIKEGKYPLWVRFSVGGIVMKIKNLQTQIETEGDVVKQNKLISHQNTLLSYISGLGVGVSSTDNVLLQRLKGRLGGKK